MELHYLMVYSTDTVKSYQCITVDMNPEIANLYGHMGKLMELINRINELYTKMANVSDIRQLADLQDEIESLQKEIDTLKQNLPEPKDTD